MGEIVERVASAFRRRASVRRLALHAEQDGGDAGGGERQFVGFDARGFEGEYRVMLAAELGEHVPRARGTDFLVGVDQHGHQPVIAQVHRLEDGQRVNNECDPLLVVGDTQTVRAVAVDPERLLGEHATQIDGIHVRDQQDLLAPGTGEPRVHHLADFFRRIDHVIDVRWIWLDHLDLSAERRQAIGDQRRKPVEARAIAAAGLDRHQFLEGGEERRLLFRRQRLRRLERRRLRAHGKARAKDHKRGADQPRVWSRNFHDRLHAGDASRRWLKANTLLGRNVGWARPRSWLSRRTTA